MRRLASWRSPGAEGPARSVGSVSMEEVGDMVRSIGEDSGDPQHHVGMRLKSETGMKGLVRAHIEASVSSERDQQKDSLSWLKAAVDSGRFTGFVAAVIVLNAVMIGVETDVDFTADVSWEIFHRVQEYSFTIFFTLELLLKLFVHGPWIFFCNHQERFWNCFDCLLVIVGLVDTVLAWMLRGDDMNLTQVRLLRLLRLARIVRLLRVVRLFRQLYIFVQGVVTAATVTFWGLLLIGIVTYMSASDKLWQRMWTAVANWVTTGAQCSGRCSRSSRFLRATLGRAKSPDL